MDPHAPLALVDSIAAAQAWWRDAGVDLDYHEEPRGWLAPLEVKSEAAAPAPSRERPNVPPPLELPTIGGDRTTWPSDLVAFHRWWLEEASLDTGGLHPRIAPRGPSNARLMILVPMPEAADSEILLSGPQGRLISGMLRAMGLAAAEVYLAAALPRHMTLPAWGELAANGLREVLRHHLALAAPRRLLVLGRDILPLVGHDPTQEAPAINHIEIQTGQLPLLSSYAPGRLLDHPRRRAELWQRWLEWTDGVRE